MSSISRRRRPALLPWTPDSKTFHSSSRIQKSAPMVPVTTARGTPAKKASRSRNGCWTCRNRKVKCDEAHPKCTPCSRLGEVCDYTRQVSYKDDTPKILRKLAKLTDTAGCPVYDPTVKQIFHPYPHLQQDCADGADAMDFVVLFASDYADTASRSPMEGSCSSSRRGSADSSSWSNDDDEDTEDTEEQCHRKTQEVHRESDNVIEQPSQGPSRLVQSTAGEMAHVNASLPTCSGITRCSRQLPGSPPSGLNESNSIFQAEESIDSSGLTLNETDSVPWSFDRQSSDYYSYLPDSDHHQCSRIASEPAEIMQPTDMNMNHVSMFETTPTAWLHHQGALYDPFKRDPEEPVSQLDGQGNTFLYHGRPFLLTDGLPNDLGGYYHLHKSQDSSTPVIYTSSLDHFWQPQFALPLGVDSAALTSMTLEN
ncbi:hypothetical protein V1509DRAFT_614065 [Lipomyces kononenkoae]